MEQYFNLMEYLNDEYSNEDNLEEHEEVEWDNHLELAF